MGLKMEEVKTVPIWAWGCPDCEQINLLTKRPKKGAQVICGGPYNDPDHGCGAIYIIGQVSEDPVVANLTSYTAKSYLLKMP